MTKLLYSDNDNLVSSTHKNDDTFEDGIADTMVHRLMRLMTMILMTLALML